MNVVGRMRVPFDFHIVDATLLAKHVIEGVSNECVVDWKGDVSSIHRSSFK